MEEPHLEWRSRLKGRNQKSEGYKDNRKLRSPLSHTSMSDRVTL
ncbi:MAG: hypothetical protein ACFE0I_20985 [Elainellaceae cyanobacterium]